jgi:hypothetical protein
MERADMTALTAIRRAHQAGVMVARDGQNLVLRASHPPAAEVVDLLKKFKPDIIALLETQSVAHEKDETFKCDTGRSSVQSCDEWKPPSVASTLSVNPLPCSESGPSYCPSFVAQEGHDDANHKPTDLLCGGLKGVKGGESGASVVPAGNDRKATSQAQEPDPNPNLPWPLPGETLLPGWGKRVSMEYRLRTASEDECLEWANEPSQLELVAKARGYSQEWVDQVLRNRAMWREAFAARSEGRAPNFEHLSRK